MMENRLDFEKIIKEKYENIAGLIVLKQGEMVYENYFNQHNSQSTLHIASVTKSIISILTGIAMSQGLIESVDQKVLDFFPEYQVKSREKTIQTVSIKDLLTMTAPYKYKSEPYTKVFTSQDWTKAALDLLGGNGEPKVFRYSTLGIQILAGILCNATGKNLLDYATLNLFLPLGISSPENRTINTKEEYLDFLKNKGKTGWILDPSGVNTAGWGLALTARDMAKIGQLFLNNGVWNHSQIVPPQWIIESTTQHSNWGDKGYGYLWWITGEGYGALGDGGNAIYVNPQNNMVVAILAGFKPRAKDPIQLIEEIIVPEFKY